MYCFCLFVRGDFHLSALFWVFSRLQVDKVVAENGSPAFRAGGTVAECRALGVISSNIKQTINCNEETFLGLCTVAGSAAWAPSWSTGRCSRAPASTPACRLWACGRRCWRRASLITVSLAGCQVLPTCCCVCALPCSAWRCVSCSGPGAELPGQVPLLPLPGGRAGGRSAAQRGGEEAEPGGAAGHPAAPLADRTGRPHEDDLEETVRIECKSPRNSKSGINDWADFSFCCAVHLKEQQRIWKSFMKSCSTLRR